ncbi:MAG TPA: RNA polymerase sigma factor [Gaiellaceae bacterium]
MAAVPSIGRATRIERPVAPGADAASDLYERYSAQIYGYCLHQLGSREEAEDAVQTTFMNAFRGLSRGIVPELESAWLFKIAHNVCLSRRRSSWRRGKVEAPNNFEVLQEIVPGREQVADELIRLQDVLEEMPENQRRAILLREWQGLTYREISAELGLSQAAVETLIFRARRALAQGLEQDADTWKRRLRRGADVGGAIACAKALLGGGGAAAVKIAATALAVATAAVATASTPTLTHAHHAPAAKPKPAAATHSARKITASGPGMIASAPSKIAPRSEQPRSVERRLPRPVALPVSSPEDTTAATPLPPAPAAPEPAPPTASTETEPSAAPADTAPGKGDEKGQRRPQSTTQADDPAPLPPAPAADPTPPPAADAPGQENKPNKPEHPDHPDNGNGNGNGPGNGKK